jgi:hypothetical protein
MHCSLIVAKAGIIILDNNWFHGNHQHQHQHQHTDDGISSTPSTPSTPMTFVDYFQPICRLSTTWPLDFISVSTGTDCHPETTTHQRQV